MGDVTGLGADPTMDEGGMLSNGQYWGEGLPKGWSGGLHYSNKWNNDKIGLNSGYQYGKLNSEASGLVKSQYILPDTLYYINENGNSFNTKIETV